MNKWIEAITESRKDQAEKVPAGFITGKEFSKQIGLKAHARVIMARLIADGRAERRDFTVLIGGVPRKIPHYRLK